MFDVVLSFLTQFTELVPFLIAFILIMNLACDLIFGRSQLFMKWFLKYHLLKRKYDDLVDLVDTNFWSDFDE